VATALLRAGCATVVAMAYSVYAVAAAEFMAVFYERLFAGDAVSAAVTAGRRRLSQQDLRPSPKGNLPLADWLVPVHYLRRDVAFPQARATRPPGAPSLEQVLDKLATPGAGRVGARSLDPAAGVFVGRDDLFYELEAAMRLQRVVLLHGPGGTGKTELAKAFGRWWRDTGGTEQPDWVVWQPFEPGVASFDLDRVVTEAGLQVFGAEFARGDSEERRRAVEDLLAERRLLLIWDNFESVRSMPDPAGATQPIDDARCGELREFLARLAVGAHSAVIITSRTPEDWLGDVRRIQLGGLAQEEAAEYAIELLAPHPAAAPRRARRAFGELLDWLDGHPLSMRLILPRLDTSDPETLLAGLRGTVPLPGAASAGEALDSGRATSLASSITYSFAHLDARTQQLLPAVCLFHGVADANVLGAFSEMPDVPVRFAGASIQAWHDILNKAAQVGLVAELGKGMFRIHPALPAYLAAEWRAGDADGYSAAREAASQTLVRAYAKLGGWLFKQIRSNDAERAYKMIDEQRRTLGAQLGYALDHELWAEAQAIGQPLSQYWTARGLDAEAQAWTDRILAATTHPAGAPPRLDGAAGDIWLWITSDLAIRQRQTMRLDDAEHTYRQMLAMLHAQPTTPQQRARVANANHNLGMIAQDRGRLDEAEDWYHKSLAIVEDLGYQPGMAMTYHQLGMVAQSRGRLGEAEDWFRKSLTIEWKLGNQPGIATSYHYLGMVAQQQGRLNEAEEWSYKSLDAHQKLENSPGMADSYHELGNIAYLRGQLNEAERFYRMSLTIKEKLGNQPEIATLYLDLGNLATAQRRAEDAENWYRRSLAIRERLGDKSRVADVHNNLAGLLLDQLRLDEAKGWCVKALAIKKEVGDLLGVAIVYHNLGGVALRQQQLDEAEGWYRKSLGIEQDLKNHQGIATSYWQLGVIDIKRKKLRRALKWMVRSVTVFTDFPHPLTGPAPRLLAQLTDHIGVRALDRCWREVTGSQLPETVRDYVRASRTKAT